jgi:hypothetical protein
VGGRQKRLGDRGAGNDYYTDLGGVMTVVLIVCAVLALIVLAVILAGHGHALRTAPKRIRASRPYRRPRSPDG